MRGIKNILEDAQLYLRSLLLAIVSVVAMVVIYCLFQDWSLVECFIELAMRMLGTPMFIGALIILTGIVAVAFWLIFWRLNNSLRYLDDMPFILWFFSIMICVCPLISLLLSKLGLRLVPSGAGWWSWISFANIMTAQVIFVALSLAVIASLESWLFKFFDRIKAKRRNKRRKAY